MKELTDLLHLLTCDLPHATDPTSILNRKENTCYYYLECDIAEGQTMPDHVLWEGRAERFKIAMGFKTNEATLAFVRDCININHEIAKVASGLEARKEFIRVLINF